MPDKNLTDSEIVKDLNEAEDLENVLLYCKNPNKEVMTPIKITDIRDLINRLQAENERLKEFVTSKCKDCAGCTSWKCDCANIERVAYEKCIEKVKEEIKQALESNHKAKHEHIKKHYQCLSCDFLATVRGKIDALSGLDYFLDNLLKEMVGEDK